MDPSDIAYLEGCEIVALPRLLPCNGEVFLGWYLTPDFLGEPIESLEGLDVGTVLYARIAAQ